MVPRAEIRVLFSTRPIAQRVSVALKETLGILLHDPVDVLQGDAQVFKAGSTRRMMKR
jgi:hypothetical protein